MNSSQQTKLAGVIGWPIQHSLSPRLHGFWLKEHDIKGHYVPLAVQPQDIELAIIALPKLGFVGANVTVPHKQEVFNLVDEMDISAKKIGAVNTVIVKTNGQLFGTNTDAYGFIENIKTMAGDAFLKHRPALVLGAGGAARGVIYALLDHGLPEIRLINRTFEKAQELEHQFGPKVKAAPWTRSQQAMDGIGLLVNTTSLGMVGKPPLNFELSPLPRDAVVTDIVYNPLMTPLLNQANQLGNITVDGLGMLLHQARPGFKAWFGSEPVVSKKLRNHVLLAMTGD